MAAGSIPAGGASTRFSMWHHHAGSRSVLDFCHCPPPCWPHCIPHVRQVRLVLVHGRGRLPICHSDFVNARAMAAQLVVAAALPAAVLAAGPTPVAAADGCPDVELVFARGTAEPPGMGRVGD